MLTPQTFNTFLRGNGLDVLNVNVAPTDPGAPAFTTRPGDAAARASTSSPTCASWTPDFQDIRRTRRSSTYDRELAATTPRCR